MVPKTTVAMFHWVNIDYDIFMKLELKNLKGDSSRTNVVLGEKKSVAHLSALKHSFWQAAQKK